MSNLYLITGACGHLGSALCTLLINSGKKVKALALESDDITYIHSLGAEVTIGDVCKIETLESFFNNTEEAILIHCAGIVDITDTIYEKLKDVNVNGTRNIIEMALKKSVSKMIYVSSVHAIPEASEGKLITETNHFNPDDVIGAYAKTKAEATQLVLDNIKNNNLPAIIVHPSGIIGPYSGKSNHLIQLIKNYLNGKLSYCVKGGYDFVDVRDVAAGIVAALEYGKTGECYILSGKYCTIKNLLEDLKNLFGGKKVKTVPMWLAKLFIPAMSLKAKRKKMKPLYTDYSLKTLLSNGNFSHKKASDELNYHPRNLISTLTDTVNWLIKKGEILTKKSCLKNKAVSYSN